MKTPLERRIAARQRVVDAGGKSITLRRPTEYEKVKHGDLPMLEYISQFVDDCPLTEADLFPGGSADLPVPFSQPLFLDWASEHPELWAPLMNAISEMVAQHEQARDEALKN